MSSKKTTKKNTKKTPAERLKLYKARLARVRKDAKLLSEEFPAVETGNEEFDMLFDRLRRNHSRYEAMLRTKVRVLTAKVEE